jgi:hypothetical protein
MCEEETGPKMQNERINVEDEEDEIYCVTKSKKTADYPPLKA